MISTSFKNFKNKLDKKTLLIILLILILLLQNSENSPSEQSSKSSTVSTESVEAPVIKETNPIIETLVPVTEVIDGDTFKVLIDGKSETVRLIAVDTPELSHPQKPVQCFADEAKKYLVSMIQGKNIKLENEPKDNDRDRYGRLLRYVYLEDGTNINNALVKNGYAFEQTYVEGYKYQELFKTSQKEAEGKKAGLWNPNTCNGDTSSKPLKPDTNITVPPPIYTPAVEGSSTRSYSCDCSKSCTKITTCEEAKYQLDICGCSVRDGDDDGIPCENICK